jgi:Ca2+-binding EF-hand superfamily protein
MTTFLNRIPQMILTITALTFGTAGVAVASPGHGSTPAQYAKPMALAAQGPAKMQRKGQRNANKQARQANKQARQANKQARQATKQAKRSSKKQARHANRLATFDSNRNGTIEASERRAVRQQRFVAIDANRDGALTLREMELAKAARRDAKKSQRLANRSPEQRSKRADRMANLTPAKQAKRAARKAKRQAKRPTLAKRFTKLDANQNGSVSRSEFVQRPGKAKRQGKGKRGRS